MSHPYAFFTDGKDDPIPRGTPNLLLVLSSALVLEPAIIIIRIAKELFYRVLGLPDKQAVFLLRAGDHLLEEFGVFRAIHSGRSC